MVGKLQVALLRGWAPQVYQVLGGCVGVGWVGEGGGGTTGVRNHKITLCCISLKWMAKRSDMVVESKDWGLLSWTSTWDLLREFLQTTEAVQKAE